ncbi:protein of unknown function [Candidatus Nitrotoga arctica]|uniref:WYL domain-containing protein n=1 Tax=Candidatus Nitrotoga arctica TaxID=453162 RepID=A0ABM9D522_9PROT|nr:protein of unknown function [Candidatus Nitrotoga arctica]
MLGADGYWHPQPQCGGNYELRVPYLGLRELVRNILKDDCRIEVITSEILRNVVAEHLKNVRGCYR